MRILVVEDHVELAVRIAEGLRDAGMAVDVVHDGAAALDFARSVPYQVVVLDRDIPVVHGDQVCRELAQESHAARVLMLTASSQIDDRVSGFELGADDYLCKPFAFQELVARVRALSRREPSRATVLHNGDLTVDRARHRVTRAGIPLVLTRKEFGVLEHLIAADGAVVSAEHLLEQVWDVNTDPFTNTVTVTIARLRKKLGEPAIIDTVIGSGYRL
jgi:DNA-binding response OmpR family regulator